MSQKRAVDAKWLRSLTDKVECSIPAAGRAEPVTIFKVPEHIRATSPSDYEPKIISIGPYHRNKPNLRYMEQVKLHYLSRTLRDNPRACLEDYLSMLAELTVRARSCYFGDIGMDDEEFLQMLLLDGCSIVCLMLMVFDRKRNKSERGDDMIISNRMNASLVLFDMLLLENQIPLFVLESLLRLVAGSGGESRTLFLTRIAIYFFRGLLPHEISRNPPAKARDFDHLLHLFHSCATSSLGDLPLFAGPFQTFDASDHAVRKPMRTIPSATDLKLFVMKGNDKFWDISLTVQLVLLVSPEHIDSSSSSFYRNLIAFEQQHSPLTMVKSQVTVYTMLMSCLIKTDDDLKFLERKSIISYALGTHDAVLFFNNLCKDTIVDYNGMFDANLKHIADYS